jgi:ATP-binding cassette subfamily F protein 3
MITFKQVSLQRGTKLLLEDCNLTIHQGQRMGITGANGSGKSTLFQLLLGELPCDQGDIEIPADWRISHMAQQVEIGSCSAVDYVLDGDQQLRSLQQALANAEQQHDDQGLVQIHAELDAIDGYNADYRAEQLLHGLGFSQSSHFQPANSFSGGWRIRLNLAKALMCPGDLLLLDEPTNHLDLDATLWLEQWLSRFPGTLLLISHDRDFLDNVVNQIVHIEQRQLNLYRGNYSAFEGQRAERLAQQQLSFEKQQQRIQQIQRFVDRFRAKATKARQAQSRLKELERMERIAPAHVDSPFSFSFPAPERFSDPLLNLSTATLGYNSPLLKGINLSLHPGSRIGLLGANGAGKSTLIKTLLGDLPLLSGEKMCGEHLHIGYFAQHQMEALDLQASPFLHLQRLSPQAREQEIRNFLGGFNFHGDQALASIEHFSGGEKARLALAIVAWQKPNLLLLDEPTNHLDLEMRHSLTLALQEFEGAIVLVSHDRHLIRNTVDELLLVHDGRVDSFNGDLHDYQRWLLQKDILLKDEQAEQAITPAQSPSRDKKALRQQAAEQRKQLSPLKKQLQHAEQSMETLQAELASIEVQLGDNSLYDISKKSQLQELLQRQGAIKQQLDDCEENWLTLQEKLETLEQSLAAAVN